MKLPSIVGFTIRGELLAWAYDQDKDKLGLVKISNGESLQFNEKIYRKVNVDGRIS